MAIINFSYSKIVHYKSNLRAMCMCIDRVAIEFQLLGKTSFVIYYS